MQACEEKLCSVKLRETEFIDVLRRFRKLLATNVGADGRLNLIVTGGGYAQLASSSSQLAGHTDQFGNPVVQFVVNIMNGQKDFGLYIGVLISSVLEHTLLLQADKRLTNKECVELINFMLETCHKVLNSNRIKIPIDFSTVLDFLPMVRTVLTSKFTGRLAQNTVQRLSVMIVKAFLHSLNEEHMTSGHISLSVEQGSEDFKFVPGALYQLVYGDDSWICSLTDRCTRKRNSVVLLFTTALDDDHVPDSNRLKKVFRLLENAVSMDVRLVACQKVVNKDVLLFLRRKSIVVLQRMGTELAKNVERLSGAFPISDIANVSAEDLKEMAGVIDNTQIVQFGKRTYFAMESRAACMGSLLLQVPSFVGVQQLKVVVEQALASLRLLTQYPYLCPGAGCLEMCLWKEIQRSGVQRFPRMRWDWLLQALISAAGRKLPLWMDTVFEHVWSDEDATSCGCRLLTRDVVKRNGGSWTYITKDECTHDNNGHDLGSVDVRKLKVSPCAVVDSFYLKLNAIIISLESCIHLSSIGTVVYRKSVE